MSNTIFHSLVADSLLLDPMVLADLVLYRSILRLSVSTHLIIYGGTSSDLSDYFRCYHWYLKEEGLWMIPVYQGVLTVFVIMNFSLATWNANTLVQNSAAAILSIAVGS